MPNCKDIGKYIKKVTPVLGWGSMLVGLASLTWWCTVTDPGMGAGASLVSPFPMSYIYNKIIFSFQNITDTEDWKRERRKFQRGGFINLDTSIRITFAYLYSIYVDGKYLLVKNRHGTGKYQPPGGVYKADWQELQYLEDKFSIKLDDNIKPDKTTEHDYRMMVPNGNLIRFVEAFDQTKNRENICNLSREFKDRLIDTGILHFKEIQYRWRGRHMSFALNPYYNCYELQLADIIDIQLDDFQKGELRKLIKSKNKDIRFASAKEIKSRGIRAGTKIQNEIIASHSFKILCSKRELMTVPDNGDIYKVKIADKNKMIF